MHLCAPIGCRALAGTPVLGLAAFVLGLASIVMSVREPDPMAPLIARVPAQVAEVESSTHAMVGLPATLSTARSGPESSRDRDTALPIHGPPNMVAQAHLIQSGRRVDLRAFLLCTALQVHSPAKAASLRPNPQPHVDILVEEGVLLPIVDRVHSAPDTPTTGPTSSRQAQSG
jgi:hypothetical protein